MVGAVLLGDFGLVLGADGADHGGAEMVRPLAGDQADAAGGEMCIRDRIYSTGLPPACVAAAIAALDLIEREPGYAARPVQKAIAFTKAAGLPEAQSPIVPVIIGEEEATLAASRLLADEGFLAAAIRPPSVPPGTARLRLTFTAQHPDDAIARLAELVRNKIMAH